MRSAARHALIENRSDVRFCHRCGAQIAGPGRWGHDDDCPIKSGDDSLRARIERAGGIHNG